MKPELKDWIEWKTQCARKLCDSETQIRLGAFAQSRFGIQLRRQLHTTNLQDGDAMRQLPSADDAWHRFESFAALTQTRQGKRYKDWIFARVAVADTAPLDTIQSGATLIIRSVVRSHLKAEYSSRTSVSMSQPLGGSDLTIGDLLPGSADPFNDVVADEYNMLAEKHATTIFGTLSYREKIGLLAKFSGISLNHNDVLKTAGCGKTVFNKAVHGFFLRLRKNLEHKYCDDGSDAIMALAVLVVQFLEKEIILWKNAEKGLPDCFY